MMGDVGVGLCEGESVQPVLFYFLLYFVFHSQTGLRETEFLIQTS